MDKETLRAALEDEDFLKNMIEKETRKAISINLITTLAITIVGTFIGTLAAEKLSK